MIVAILKPGTLKVLGIGDAVHPWVLCWGCCEELDPDIVGDQGCCKTWDTDGVKDAVKPWMLTVSGMLLSPGS